MKRDALIDLLIADFKRWTRTALEDFAAEALFERLDKMSDEEVAKAQRLGWHGYLASLSPVSQDDEDEE